jgi:UDP-N-acetylmuramoylalanine--D-glutamate ligase
MNFKDLSQAKKILIYGYARAGQSSFKFMRTHFPKLKIDIYDAAIKRYAKLPNLKTYDVIIVSPGIDRTTIDKRYHGKLTDNTALFFANISEEQRKRVIGITGTKGKSTTTKFCTEVLTQSGYKAVSAGNFGTALLDFYDQFTEGKLDYVVAELSSYQLEHLKYSPGIAVFLSLFADHLHRHKTMEKYFRAKQNIWRHQKAEDVLVVPEKWRPLVQKVKSTIKGKVIFAKPLKPSFFPMKSIFQAPHFRENFGTIHALKNILGLSDKHFQKTARAFRGLPHRLELVATRRGIDFYNDSISTNPDSTLAGMRFFGNRIGSVILGGQDRGQNFASLVRLLKKKKIYVIVYRSEISDRLVKEFIKQHFKLYIVSSDLGQAVEQGFKRTAKNKICLMSTAAPSFDRFKNFEQRGELFRRYVLNYK